MRTWHSCLLLCLLLLTSTAFAQSSSPKPTPEQSSSIPQAQSTAAENGSELPARLEDPAENGRNWHVKLGTISVGAAYSHFSGPFFPYGPYGFYPYDWFYSSIIWNPWWPPYPGFAPGYFSSGYGKGEVKLKAEPRDADVYLDGAYAGTADRLKTIWLDPGAYNLSVSAKDHEPYQQRIYILSGKSLKISADLAKVKEKQP